MDSVPPGLPASASRSISLWVRNAGNPVLAEGWASIAFRGRLAAGAAAAPGSVYYIGTGRGRDPRFEGAPVNTCLALVTPEGCVDFCTLRGLEQALGGALSLSLQKQAVESLVETKGYVIRYVAITEDNGPITAEQALQTVGAACARDGRRDALYIGWVPHRLRHPGDYSSPHVASFRGVTMVFPPWKFLDECSRLLHAGGECAVCLEDKGLFQGLFECVHTFCPGCCGQVAACPMCRAPLCPL
jgi:hypothetical protein